MRGVDQLFAEQLFRCDPGGRGKAVIRAGTVGEQEIRQGRYGIENRQGRCSLPGRDDIALIGAEVQHRVVLHHIGDIDQLVQAGVQVFLRLRQQSGVAVRYFLAVAVNEVGIGHTEKKRDRQDEHERIGKDIPVEGFASFFHIITPFSGCRGYYTIPPAGSTMPNRAFLALRRAVSKNVYSLSKNVNFKKCTPVQKLKIDDLARKQ